VIEAKQHYLEEDLKIHQERKLINSIENNLVEELIWR